MKANCCQRWMSTLPLLILELLQEDFWVKKEKRKEKKRRVVLYSDAAERPWLGQI